MIEGHVRPQGDVRVRLSSRQRLKGLAFNAVVVFTFGGVWTFAGHGGGPIGLTLVLGSVHAWGLPMALGWVAIGLLVLVTILPWRWLYGSVLLAGMATLIAAWWLFASRSESIASALPLSIPFFVALAARVVYLFRNELSGAKRA